VLIEQERASRWRVIGRARLGRHSNYGMPYRFPAAGASVKLRTVLPATARNIRSVSRVLLLAAQP
jgi:hypothetical protein